MPSMKKIVLMSILGVIFWPFSASAIVLYMNDYTPDPVDVACSSELGTGRYPEFNISGLNSGSIFGSVTMVVKASSTITNSEMTVYRNGNPIMSATTTVGTNRLDVGFVWNVANNDWRCVAVA